MRAITPFPQTRNAYPVCGAQPTAGVRQRRGKRAYDIGFSMLGLIVLAPLFVLIAILIKSFDGGRVFYRQGRVGLHGREFEIWKFRTMRTDADARGPAVTRGGDARITPLGRLLRKLKVDELPQLWNVLRGDMSLVGPRPEVPRYLQAYTPAQRPILNYKPGITDLATLLFRNEESLLGQVQNVEQFYVQHCIGRKVELNLEYARRASLASDTWIIVRTLLPSSFGLLLLYSALLLASICLSLVLAGPMAFPWEGRGPASAQFAGTERGIFSYAAVIAVQLAALAWRRQHKGLLSFFSLPELWQTFMALGVASFVLLMACLTLPATWLPPINVLMLDGIIALVLVGAVRTGARASRERRGRAVPDPTDPGRASFRRVAIVGAGHAGAHLAREIAVNGHGKVVAFFDDNVRKWNKRLHEIPIVGMPECLLEGWRGKLDEVIIAIPDVSPGRLQEIERLVERADFKCEPEHAMAHASNRFTRAPGGTAGTSRPRSQVGGASPDPTEPPPIRGSNARVQL